MSFLTPARLQDASKVLKGVALVAAKAASESPALKRCAEGDLNSALKEALKSVSKQSNQLASMLDSASREQTGASVNEHLNRGQEAVQQVANLVNQQAQGISNQGQAAFEQMGNVQNELSNRVKAGAQNLSAQAQRANAGLQRDGPEAVKSTVIQGKETLQGALRKGQELTSESASPNIQSALKDADQSLSQITKPASESLAREKTAFDGPQPYLVLDFSSGSGVATAHPKPSKNEVQAQETTKASIGRTINKAETSDAQLSVSASGPQLETVSTAIPSDDSLRVPEQQLNFVESEQSDLGSTSRVTSDASNVLRNQAEQGSFAETQEASPAAGQKVSETVHLEQQEEKLEEIEKQTTGAEQAQVKAEREAVKRKLKERRVPSSPIGRVAGFAQLGASLVYGTLSDQVSSYFRGGSQENQSGNKYLTERNAERLADALCRMRGAALKLGQLLSIQDENVLPPQLSAALERVRAGADVMPKKQLEKVLTGELGPEWRSKVANFEDEPLAAASIGQVHGATLHDGRRVVMKIQYPGVARSIESDVDNLLRIISLANILPKGMYIENAARVAKKELKLECNYEYEAQCQARFAQLIDDDLDFKSVMHVPAVIPELCSESVLCSEWVPGVHIDKVAEMSQPIRDAVGTLVLQLTLRELFAWRFMQTDPNWGNFLYDEAAGKLNLIDFGAAREFPVGFVDDYLSMVRACADKDKEGVIKYSTKLGFLTGDESKVMLDAHSEAGFVVGTPFSSPGLYDFAKHGRLTKQVSELGAVMLKHRLTAPPEESYSLHRKLSGAFLACIKLRAKIPCREIFFHAYDRHKWGHEGVTKDELPDLKQSVA